MADFSLILASASPRRVELLRRIGIDAEVLPSGLQEGSLPGEEPAGTVSRLAEAKCRDVALRLGPEDLPRVVLAADTAVVLDGDALGKPADDVDAGRMLRRLGGRVHQVLTGVFTLRTDTGDSDCRVEATSVRFRPLDDRLIRWYVATGESRGKAGAYGIQGRGVLLTESIEGSWSNVVGLPLEILPSMFRRLGLDLYNRSGRATD